MAERFVTIQGRRFRWSAAEGLEPDVVLTLQNWIIKMARTYLPKAMALHFDMDDLIQAGNIGALKAARTWNPKCKTKFITWATFRIRDEMGKLCRGKCTYSLDGNCDGCDSNNDCDRCDRKINVAYMSERRDATLDAAQILSKLTPRDRHLLTLYYGIKRDKPATARDIASYCGVSPQTIYLRVNAALMKAMNQVEQMKWVKNAK